jgi:ABC-type polysaccharide/polyol phosphate transport system ATPase subunit
LITVNEISKFYKLYPSKRHRIKDFFDPFNKGYFKIYHALNSISFSLAKGEVLGIIGKNGSGKSTLLKILASVVSPTSGSFEANGRVSALLELSAGFNKTLNGIENIYFLGAIQGFRKMEMKERLQSIVDFAELGEYIHQPVKTYSSGMQVRLAFSQAINVDPDILIVDEALAVGDLRFQQKCFRKIKDFKEAGKTIIMCTHNLAAVKEFCDRAIWLHEGAIKEVGQPELITQNYAQFMLDNQTNTKQDLMQRTFGIL